MDYDIKITSNDINIIYLCVGAYHFYELIARRSTVAAPITNYMQYIYIYSIVMHAALYTTAVYPTFIYN